jgi:two-component system chemotaxis response regulator CheY
VTTTSSGPILIIDDEAGVRLLLRTFLEMLGYTVLEAENGQQGSTLAAQRDPALVICDGNMPVMDGMTTLRTLRAAPATARLPFVFLTGNDCPQRRAAARELGATAFLLKPIDLGTLERVIAEAISQPVAG